MFVLFRFRLKVSGTLSGLVLTVSDHKISMALKVSTYFPKCVSKWIDQSVNANLLQKYPSLE